MFDEFAFIDANASETNVKVKTAGGQKFTIKGDGSMGGTPEELADAARESLKPHKVSRPKLDDGVAERTIVKVVPQHKMGNFIENLYGLVDEPKPERKPRQRKGTGDSATDAHKEETAAEAGPNGQHS